MYENDITEKLYNKMQEYEKRFDDIVPLMEVPSMSEDELIEKIDLALVEDKKLLEVIPEIKKFYGENEISS